MIKTCQIFADSLVTHELQNGVNNFLNSDEEFVQLIFITMLDDNSYEFTLVYK